MKALHNLFSSKLNTTKGVTIVGNAGSGKTSGPASYIVKELINKKRPGIIFGHEGNILTDHLKDYSNVTFVNIYDFKEEDLLPSNIDGTDKVFYISIDPKRSREEVISRFSDEGVSTFYYDILEPFWKNHESIKSNIFFHFNDEVISRQCIELINNLIKTSSYSVIVERQFQEAKFSSIMNLLVSTNNKVGEFKFNHSKTFHFPLNSKPSKPLNVN